MGIFKPLFHRVDGNAPSADGVALSMEWEEWEVF